MTRTQRFVGN